MTAAPPRLTHSTPRTMHTHTHIHMHRFTHPHPTLAQLLWTLTQRAKQHRCLGSQHLLVVLCTRTLPGLPKHTRQPLIVCITAPLWDREAHMN
mmetsp:Transcript_20053/g.55823  ORF Transcript_20053/g.55823 Transcript_20053/m.55823 type:complete len:93 (-) Transcript_20053:215-493(-)